MRRRGEVRLFTCRPILLCVNGLPSLIALDVVDSSWNVMAHGDGREGKWRGNWRTEWVTSTLRAISEHGVSSITTADAHTSAASSQLNWRPRRFKWTRPFRRKTKSGFCACAITFQLAYTYLMQSSFQGSVIQIFWNVWTEIESHLLLHW